MEVAHIAGNPDDVRFAVWFAGYNGLTVSVMYAKPGEQRNGLQDCWHPRIGAKNLVIADFRGRKPPPAVNGPPST
jgi:hypothetical protein